MIDDPISDLLAKVALQDRLAFRALYAQSSAKLLGVLIRILGQKSEAEDALQEVYTRVWLRANRFDAEKGRGMTWLITLARNHAIDRLRQRHDAPISDDAAMDAVADTSPLPETRMIAQGEAQRIADCFATLEPDRAEALRGAYIAGLSYTDLAERHNLPLNTLRTWLRRGLLKLKDCLEQ